MVFVLMVSLSTFGIFMLVDWSMHGYAGVFLMCAVVIGAVGGFVYGDSTYAVKY